MPFTPLLHRKHHRWLHLRGEAKWAERKEMSEPKARIQNAAQTRPRRERPRPLTHRASRALRGRSRLGGATIAPNGLGRVQNFGKKKGPHRRKTYGNR